MKEDSYGSINKNLEEIIEKVNNFEENYSEKIKNLKALLKNLEESFVNKFALNENYESSKKNIQDKIADFEIKFINLERKGDAN